MKLLRNITFGLVAVVAVVLATATVAETIQGSTAIYRSPLFVALWVAVAAFSLSCLIIRRVQRRPAVFLLHLSFVVILVGALITHCRGIQGAVHLRQGGGAVSQFSTTDGGTAQLPFSIALDDFQLLYYQGTRAPIDFVSHVIITDGGERHSGTVSMNNIYSRRGYRFYQSTYDSDGHGSTLSIYHDPWGIAVTYTGYGLLLLSMILFFFDRGSQFRQLLRRTAAVAAAFVATASPTFAAKTVPQATASRFGDIYVYYNDRICPMQTLAHDFTTKIHGQSSYKGLTAEQVLLGWFFYYDDWKSEPIILIKSREVQQLLGIEGRYARLSDFFDSRGYKLDEARHIGSAVRDLRAVREADEKFNLISMASTGTMLKLYPYAPSDSVPPTWYAVTDRLPPEIEREQWLFIRYSMNYIAEQVARRDFEQVDTLIAKTKRFQEREAAGYLPSDTRFRAERLYNTLTATRPAAMACLTVGLLSFFYYCQRHRSRWVKIGLASLMAAALLYMLVILVLRGIVAGHFPASNGFETMLLMSASVMALSLALHRRFGMILSFGFMLSGLALLVAMFGQANPSVTPLLPVLSSPLLSIHVVVIMVAYSLFGFAMFNGLAAIIARYSASDWQLRAERLMTVSRLMLYPATFLLAAGIFIGAIWANVSWGRYWGWDPKETWALITLLVYSAALHTTSLPRLARPMAFHWFAVLAFLSVIITYFGANFIMAGLHSYA